MWKGGWGFDGLSLCMCMLVCACVFVCTLLIDGMCRGVLSHRDVS